MLTTGGFLLQLPTFCLHDMLDRRGEDCEVQPSNNDYCVISHRLIILLSINTIVSKIKLTDVVRFASDNR